MLFMMGLHVFSVCEPSNYAGRASFAGCASYVLPKNGSHQFEADFRIFSLREGEGMQRLPMK